MGVQVSQPGEAGVPAFEDVSFELKHYAIPRTVVTGVSDRRTGADTLLILTGTIILPPDIARHGGGGGGGGSRVHRKRIRFVVPQSPKVISTAAQVRAV